MSASIDFMKSATGSYRKNAIAAMFEPDPGKKAALEKSAWQAWDLATQFVDSTNRIDS